VGINVLDPATRRMHYFHNDGYFSLEGEDYDGLFGPYRDAPAGGLPLFPYAEFVKFGAPDGEAPAVAALDLLRAHLARRPKGNPLAAYAGAFEDHARALAGRQPEYFHTYAFNTLRQVGANFELLASHLDWLQAQARIDFDAPARAAERIADGAKAIQFKLARAMARQRFDGLAESIAPMAEAYEAVMAALEARLSVRAGSKAA